MILETAIAVNLASSVVAGLVSWVSEQKSRRISDEASAAYNDMLQIFQKKAIETENAIGELTNHSASAIRRHLEAIRQSARHLNPHDVHLSANAHLSLLLFDTAGVRRIEALVAAAKSIEVDNEGTALGRTVGLSAATAGARVAGSLATTAMTSTLATGLGALFSVAQLGLAFHNARKATERAAAFRSATAEMELRIVKMSAVEERANEIRTAIQEVSYQTLKYYSLMEQLNFRFEKENISGVFYDTLNERNRSIVQKFILTCECLWEMLNTPLIESRWIRFEFGNSFTDIEG